MFWRRGWSEREREREVNEGGEGVYILPPPKVTIVCFLVVPGSSGVTSDHPGSWQKRLNTQWKSQVRIIRCRAGSSGLAFSWTPTNHQVRIIRPRAGSSGLTPNHWALFGRIIRPSAETFAVKCFVSDFSQKSHLKWSILATWNSFECVPLDSTVNPILKFKPKIKIKFRLNPPY